MVDPKIRCFEVNAPAFTVTAIRQVRDMLKEPNPDMVEVFELLAEIEKRANQEVDWLRHLNAQGDKPSVMWTEFVHSSGREDSNE